MGAHAIRVLEASGRPVASVFALASVRRFLELCCLPCFAVFLFLAVAAIVNPHDLGLYEGQSFLPAIRLWRGEPIFGRDVVLDQPYLFASYGPLYYSALGLLLRFAGIVFWPGRLLSAISTAATCWIIYRTVRIATGERTAGVVSGALFILMPAVWIFGAAQRVDTFGVTWAVLALSLALLYETSNRHLFLSGILAALAFLVKPSLIAAPAAIAIYCLWKRRGRALAALAAGYAATLVLAVLLLLATGNMGWFFNQAVTAQIPLVLRNVGTQLGIHIHSPAFMAAVVLFVLSVWEMGVERLGITLPVLYVLTAGIWNPITSATLGAATNHFMELSAALAICGGLALQPWLALGARAARPVTALLITLMATSLCVLTIRSTPALILIPKARAPVYERLEAILRALPADQPVVSEYPGLVLRTGRELFFNDLSVYLTSFPNANRALQHAVQQRVASAFITGNPALLPGYGSIELMDRGALPPGLPVAFLYVREDLYQRAVAAITEPQPVISDDGRTVERRRRP